MMECCAASPPHIAGSCHTKISSPGKSENSEPQQQSDQHCGLPQADNAAADGIVAGVMGMSGSVHSSSDLDEVTIDAGDHCKTDSNSQDVDAQGNNSPDSAIVATQSFSKPCPPECGTGALSPGVRRSRDSLAVAHNEQPQPRVSGRKYQPYQRNSLITSAYCKELRPRGPPESAT